MATLYELTGEFNYLQNLIEDGEDLPIDEFEETKEAFEEKAENYAKVIRNLEAEIEGLKAEEKRLKEKRVRVEKGVENLKNNLQSAMIQTGNRKFKKGVFSFSIQKNGGALPVIVDVPTDDLDDEFVIIEEKPDKKAIEKYIKETGDVSFAHFGERGESLRIK